MPLPFHCNETDIIDTTSYVYDIFFTEHIMIDVQLF